MAELETSLKRTDTGTIAPKNTSLLVGELEKILLQEMPSEDACSWDRTGMLVGNPLEVVRGVAIALDPTIPTIKAAKESSFATATWMLPVFAYGSQLARILHHAYSDGMMATPSVTTSATGFFRMRFTSRRKMAKTWCIKPPRGYWSQHLRAAACPCGNTRLGSSSRDPVDIL